MTVSRINFLKKEEGRRKEEEGRRKKEEGRRKKEGFSYLGQKEEEGRF
ncbi:MAG: hypothetical protein SWX82_05635 [Cyanobacteriota bacterium]|nr:hypothetical protein [Cyanobacteriota bacterium]